MQSYIITTPTEWGAKAEKCNISCIGSIFNWVCIIVIVENISDLT